MHCTHHIELVYESSNKVISYLEELSVIICSQSYKNKETMQYCMVVARIKQSDHSEAKDKGFHLI